MAFSPEVEGVKSIPRITDIVQILITQLCLILCEECAATTIWIQYILYILCVYISCSFIFKMSSVSFLGPQL